MSEFKVICIDRRQGLQSKDIW